MWKSDSEIRDRIHNTFSYESAQKARVLHNTRLVRLVNDKRSNLLVHFVSYEQNVVLWIRSQMRKYTLKGRLPYYA